MTAPEQVASTAQEQAGAVAGTAKDQAASVAHSATSAAGDVTGTAKEQVGSVVGETVAQAKDLTGQVKQQASQQLAGQTGKATSALRDLSRQLHEGDTSGVVGTVLTEVGQRVQALADSLEQKGPQGLLEDVRRYARRNPGAFVLGSALAGLVAGRVAKGMTSSSSSHSDRSAAALPSSVGTAAYPSAGTGGDVFGSDVYGATTPASGTRSSTYGGATTTESFGTLDEPARGRSGALADDLLDPPAYPATSVDDPYSAGYGQTEAYQTEPYQTEPHQTEAHQTEARGTRGTL